MSGRISGKSQHKEGKDDRPITLWEVGIPGGWGEGEGQGCGRVGLADLAANSNPSGTTVLGVHTCEIGRVCRMVPVTSGT